MIKPPPVRSETERLATLRKYSVLDTPAEKDFDDLAALAAQICEAPIAMISLVDEDRQWFKATYGTPLKETPRDISFCGHAIGQKGLFIVPDATRDERFVDNPLVLGDPGIRFYAGSPLTAPDGESVGMLCVIDRKPRQLTKDQEKYLAILSRHVMVQLELRHQAQETNRVNGALLGILEDVKLAQNALRESEELSRGVLNSVLAHIAVLDREGNIIAVNDAWRKFASENTGNDPGLAARAEVGTNYLEVCRDSHGPSSEEALPVYEGLRAVLRDESDNFTLEYPCHAGGQKRWFLLSVTPLKTKNGGAAVSHLNISERKLAEEKIAEQAGFLDKARDAIIVRDLEGRIEFWNEGAETMYGWSSDEVAGRLIGTLLYPDSSRFVEANRLTIQKGEWSGNLQQITKDKREIIIEARWTLVLDQEGKPRSILAINTDITEKKKIEAQFMRAQRMESIGTLAGGIAHDLNNILAPIMMSIDILKLSADSPRSRSILETIEISAQRGADIVRQVLSFARGIEGERVEIHPKHLIRDLENIIKDTFPKDIRMQFLISHETWTILGDPTQIHQILLNLCVNARDAMPQGGVLTIAVENCEIDEQYAAMNLEAKAGRYVNIAVTDTGTGIPPALLDKIFEPFFTTKELNKGTGLGLSTVMAIVKSHGGLVNVYSEPGRGTTFKVYLPAVNAGEENRSEGSDEVHLPRGKGETVLVVDDEASILTITSQTLEAFGYRVLNAANGADALALYAQQRDEIDVVLTDMMMPVLDGPATIHAMLRINPSARIIAASGLNANGNTTQVSIAGVKHFLTKPYTAGKLLKTIRQILDENWAI